MMAPHAEAKIPIRAFKNVTKHFKPRQSLIRQPLVKQPSIQVYL